MLSLKSPTFSSDIDFSRYVPQDRALKLRIFPDEQHPFYDKPLEPFLMPPRRIREMRPREKRAAARAQKPPKAHIRE